MDNTAPTGQASSPPVIDIEKRVSQFVRLRDKIKKLDDAHKLSMTPYHEAKKRIEDELLGHLNTTNSTSAKTAAGTVSALDKASATIEDTDAFRSFVVDNEEWDLADIRANTPAVEKFLEDEQKLPPGVKISRYRTVSVRRATGT